MTDISVAQIRASLDHPVVDADGHVVESFPIVLDYMRRIAGADVADRFAGSSPTYLSRSAPLLERADEAPGFRFGVPQMAWWALPTNARDRATGFLPRLLHERLDEIGIDYAILYSSVGLACIAHPDDAVRTGACRVLNTYLAELLDGLGDRLDRGGGDPDQHPRRSDRGARPRGQRPRVQDRDVQQPRAPSGAGARPGRSLVRLPRARQPVRLRPAVATVHGPRHRGDRALRRRRAWACACRRRATCTTTSGTSRRAPTRSPRRCSSAASPTGSPICNFAFLECGVSWGVQLLCDLIDRWHKRGGANIQRLDPGRSSTPTSGTR